MELKVLAGAGCLILAAGGAYGASVSETYTLYRGVLSDRSVHIPIATFDTRHSREVNFNKENCEDFAQMATAQYGTTNVRFWCEKGRFRY